MELGEVLKYCKLFDFEYIGVSEEWKKQIEEKLIDYYYFHEIGIVPIGRFKHRFRSTWKLILHEYLEMYRILAIEYDEVLNYDLTENITTSNSGTNISKSDIENVQDNNGTSDNISKNSDLPMGSMNIDSNDNVTFLNKENSVVKNKSVTSGLSNNTNEMLGKSILDRRTFGNIGVQSTQDMIQKSLDLIHNVDEMLIKDKRLNRLFMGVL
ncbi:MAG: hypothetical protein RR500_04895 [Bacilli bacterium]